MSEPEIGGRRPIGINVVAGESYWWCACGRSKAQPFCDGSHKGTEFRPQEWKAHRTKKCGSAPASARSISRCATGVIRLSSRYEFDPSPEGGGRAAVGGRVGQSCQADESSTKARLRARRLRRNTTDAEKRLWYRLRKLDLDGSHFRRQVPIGPYIADFACMAARLVIEVDGSQHAKRLHRSARRATHALAHERRLSCAAFLEQRLARNMDGIMETVYAALYGSMAAPPVPLKHRRRARVAAADLPTLARDARRPSPCRGGNNA